MSLLLFFEQVPAGNCSLNVSTPELKVKVSLIITNYKTEGVLCLKSFPGNSHRTTASRNLILFLFPWFRGSLNKFLNKENLCRFSQSSFLFCTPTRSKAGEK